MNERSVLKAEAMNTTLLIWPSLSKTMTEKAPVHNSCTNEFSFDVSNAYHIYSLHIPDFQINNPSGKRN